MCSLSFRKVDFNQHGAIINSISWQKKLKQKGTQNKGEVPKKELLKIQLQIVPKMEKINKRRSQHIGIHAT